MFSSKLLHYGFSVFGTVNFPSSSHPNPFSFSVSELLRLVYKKAYRGNTLKRFSVLSNTFHSFRSCIAVVAKFD